MRNNVTFKNPKEIQIRKQLQTLFSDWKLQVSKKPPIIFKDDGKEYLTTDYFNCDGFYPGYFSHKQKILFIGRESRDASGCDRVESDIKFLQTFSANSSAYWRRILYIVEGIRQEGKVKFEELPYADEILDRMFNENDFGYAFMNISKYSNDSVTGGTADFDLINRFLSDSELDKRNFLKKELLLLDPDVIITSNIWGGKIDDSLLSKVFPKKDLIYNANKSTENVAAVHDFNLDGKHISLIDLYHFSSPGSDKKAYYDPVMKGLFLI